MKKLKLLAILLMATVSITIAQNPIQFCDWMPAGETDSLHFCGVKSSVPNPDGSISLCGLVDVNQDGYTDNVNGNFAANGFSGLMTDGQTGETVVISNGCEKWLSCGPYTDPQQVDVDMIAEGFTIEGNAPNQFFTSVRVFFVDPSEQPTNVSGTLEVVDGNTAVVLGSVTYDNESEKTIVFTTPLMVLSATILHFIYEAGDGSTLTRILDFNTGNWID